MNRTKNTYGFCRKALLRAAKNTELLATYSILMECHDEERKFKLVEVDEVLPGHMAAIITPSQDSVILQDAAPHTEIVNYHQVNNMMQLQDDSLCPPSYSYHGGTRKSTQEHVFIVSYKECMKNHAASLGGYATDGCGEFMASCDGIGGLNCSACNCHRNFHRREVKPKTDHFQIAAATHTSKFKTSTSAGYQLLCHSPTGLDRSRAGDRMQCVTTASWARVDNKNNKQGSEEPQPLTSQYQVGELSTSRPSVPKMTKRFRSSFSNEQKVNILEFGTRVGWKIQKQDEPGVLKLSEEMGMKRRVLKVCTHTKKHDHEVRKHHASSTTASQPQSAGSGSGSGRDALSA